MVNIVIFGCVNSIHAPIYRIHYCNIKMKIYWQAKSNQMYDKLNLFWKNIVFFTKF
jgi:hypothetical protein